MRDDEVEVARHSARSQHDQSHASHEHRREAEGAEVLDEVADRLQMIHGSGFPYLTG
jgi:hypothetical protein